MTDDYELEFVDAEPEAMPPELLEGLRKLCEYLQERDIYSAVIGVPTSANEETMEVHSLAVIYHGPVEFSIPEGEQH
jgi:hypothetical protein